MSRLIVGPFNRVEGDLEVRLDIDGARVREAWVNAPMYRGFEQILQHKHPFDAMVYVPRICGICSVSQSVAAARALADAMQVAPPPNGAIVTNLMLATENLADHLTHFYLFFMPDFARPVYAGMPWHETVRQRFAAQQGEHARQALLARQRWFTLLGTLGGKWPHTQSIHPGGSARAIDASERIRLLARIREFRAFLERTTFAAPLEQIAAIDSEPALAAWHAGAAPDAGDFRLFLTLAQGAALDTLGKGPGRYLAYGSYAQHDGTPLFARGLWDAEQDMAMPLDLSAIAEDATSAWLADQGGPRHPRQGLTLPAPDKADAYTWNKAPRLGGHVLETGALARQLVHGHPLIRDAARRCGATVYTRVLARLLELALVVPAMESWLAALRIDEPYFTDAPLPEHADGTGLTEAARGSLGHWIAIRDGRIANYQIVAPTSWNFSPRDAQGVPGALEAALVGAPVRAGETAPVSVQHIVRSFDPCMVCTVH
ncbi:nickel-dependent hydrogenase large subunit [Noviherbaspirillum autotrophicum]|uniref:HupV protein n=1 Tax=Noviherbaspirillum autotrophicum TaxID=709839 RepID=A0A0C2BII9_9BURK|nr:nickel-dependent hydrogenase large subunit [Noviherbaspirillum autotrophicum]KIF81045.1 HupV protein [Noviherbaspirillum autotrophicum]